MPQSLARVEDSKARVCLAGLFAALLPPEFGGPDPDEMVVALDRLLTRQPRAIGSAVRAGAMGIDLASLISKHRHLRALDPADREALVRRLATVKPFALGIEGLKALALLVAGSQRAAPEIFASAGGGAVMRPDAPCKYFRRPRSLAARLST
jgi:hypothetical protein